MAWHNASGLSAGDDDETIALFREVDGYFTTRHRFRGGKAIGSGAYGAAWLYDELGRDGRFWRKVVVKASFGAGAGADASVDNEVRHLAAVRGAEHIVRLLYAGPGPAAAGGLSRRAFVVDFVEHGSWQDVLFRFRDAGQRIPNRILWGVFLCLARAVAGMAYPQGAAVDGPARREVFDAYREPSTLAHQDMNLGNILVGAWNRADAEHRFSPITKVIDFGLARNLPPDEEFGVEIGIKDNISEIARVMLWLAIGHAGYEILDVEASDGPPPARKYASRVHYDLSDSAIAIELRRAIMQCRALDPRERPALSDLLGTCERAVAGGGAGFYYAGLGPPWDRLEGDAAVDAAIQRFVLDAPLTRG